MKYYIFSGYHIFKNNQALEIRAYHKHPVKHYHASCGNQRIEEVE